MKQIVIISRKWDHPKISMIVTDEQLSFCIDLIDFRNAFKKELIISNGDVEKVDQAFDRVIYGIKHESSRIIE